MSALRKSNETGAPAPICGGFQAIGGGGASDLGAGPRESLSAEGISIPLLLSATITGGGGLAAREGFGAPASGGGDGLGSGNSGTGGS